MIRISRTGGKTLDETRVLLLRHAETSAPTASTGPSPTSAWENGAGASRKSSPGTWRRASQTALYCSAMRRAVETAGPIGRACRLVPVVVEALHERRMGPLSGVPREEGLAAYEEAKRRWKAGALDYTHEGGESFEEIRRRTVPAFQELAARHPGQTIVVVAHGVVIRVLLTTLLDEFGPEDFDRLGIDNGAVNDLRWDGSRWRAVALNRGSDELDRHRTPRTFGY